MTVHLKYHDVIWAISSGLLWSIVVAKIHFRRPYVGSTRLPECSNFYLSIFHPFSLTLSC
ncbi:uncharacterized protein BDW43DRAFT_290974 [Aspergillus alliaceus]|uniref:uncharacterized protein n=1 Tax=Petromyces alliaceus TaxID=209559 RepID=UPI0012A4F489|nr:uncharacterized protein BDW43DRAFT_290974 [Aspergillus alliaceus]KAB8228590.1 hypothetical protein BDW43DRAFT_290974 [Aspergillus alliaceus]